MTPSKNQILVSLSESKKTSFGKQDFTVQSVPQKVFSSVWALESEVNNGGFSQYFLNDSSETAFFVVEALNKIGAPETADICRRAITVAFPAGLPHSAQAIRSAAASFSDDLLDALESLDQKFYSYPNDLTALLFAYVCQYPDDFGVLPKPDDQ
jgi:Domain of unknown function (DUF4375)